VTVSVWLPDLFVIWGGGVIEISDLSGEMVLSLNWSQGGVLLLSFSARSFLVLGTGDVGNPGGDVVSFLNVDIGVFFLKWDKIEGELCLPRVGRALMVLCLP
jgi:hypothetical protein